MKLVKASAAEVVSDSWGVPLARWPITGRFGQSESLKTLDRMEEDQATEEKEVKDDDEEEEEEEEMMDGFNCVEFSTGTASKQ